MSSPLAPLAALLTPQEGLQPNSAGGRSTGQEASRWKFWRRQDLLASSSAFQPPSSVCDTDPTRGRKALLRCLKIQALENATDQVKQDDVGLRPMNSLRVESNQAVRDSHCFKSLSSGPLARLAEPYETG